METENDEVLSEYLSSEYAEATTDDESVSTLDENVEEATSERQQLLQRLNQQAQQLNACLQRMTQELRQLNRSLLQETELPTPPQNPTAHVRHPLAVFQRPMPRRVTRAAERVHRLTYPPR